MSGAASSAVRPGQRTTLVLMFPGQSSRDPRMLEKLAAEFPSTVPILRAASEILGRDLAAHYRASNPQIFSSNRDIQIGIFLANHLHLQVLVEAGIEGDWSLGLSLGEYNHLVHIGALSFKNALHLIDARGRLFDKGQTGVMVSVFPIEARELEPIIAALGLERRVVIGLYNSPRQQVLSGERAAIEQVLAKLEEETLVDAVEIEQRIPMHSPLFEPVAEGFRNVLARTNIDHPRLPYVSNLRGGVVEGATPDIIRECLAAHICQSVRWKDSVDDLASRVPQALFLEVGPRAVLYNLFGRGWDPGRRARTDAVENWGKHVRDLIAELRDGS